MAGMSHTNQKNLRVDSNKSQRKCFGGKISYYYWEYFVLAAAGTVVNTDNSIEEEIKERIAAGNRAFHNLTFC